LIATLDKKLINKENLNYTFKYLDDSQEGVLTSKGLRESFMRKGIFDEGYLSEMLEGAGLSELSSKMDFRVFSELMGLEAAETHLKVPNEMKTHCSTRSNST